MEGTIELRPTAHRVVLGDQVLFDHAGRRVKLGPLDDALAWLLGTLADGTDAGRLRKRIPVHHPADAGRLFAALDALAEANIVRAVPSAPADASLVAERFSRTSLHLSQFADDSTSEHDLFGRVRAARVLLVGVGGLGSWIAQGLVGLGIGTLRLLDFDVVEASNLNRSVLFDEGDVGRPKLDAAAQHLQEQSSATAVETYPLPLGDGGLPAAAIAGVDVVVSTADKPAWVVRRAVAEACVPTSIPFLCPAGFRVGPFYAGPGTACAMCALTELLERTPRAAAALERSSAIPASQPGSVPHIAAAGAAVALQDLMRQLTGSEVPATRNRIWVAGPHLDASFHDRPPHPGCVCAAGAGRDLLVDRHLEDPAQRPVVPVDRARRDTGGIPRH